MGESLLDDLKWLVSEEPLERLAAIGRLRAALDQTEEAAVTEARTAASRRSWDEIAQALGKTRWSVLRQFGPNGAHPVGAGVAAPRVGPVVGHMAARLLEGAAGQALGTFPSKVAEVVLRAVSDLVTNSISQGRLAPDRPAVVRVEVVPGAVHVEVSDSLDLTGTPTASSASVWFELDLPGSSDRAPQRAR